MTTTEIRNILHQFIDTAQDKKIKAIYTVVEAEIERGSHWEDEAFVTEMNKRSAELESGKVKGYTWEQVKTRAKKAFKTTTVR